MNWKRISQRLGLDGLVERGVVPGGGHELSERDVIAVIRRRIDETDRAITDAPTYRDGGRYKAALYGAFSALHDLLMELDPDEPARPYPSAGMEAVQQIVDRESGHP